MKMENVLIFGDSYSTFEGFVPSGYACYYPDEEPMRTNVLEVSQTWWYQVLQKLDAKLVQNNSWSGSTVCHTGYEGRDCSKINSFVYRLEQLIADGFFQKNKIDTVFIFGGTNDSWANSPVGSLKFADWSREDLYCILPAVCYFIKTLKEQLPNAKIVCIVNDILKAEIADGIEVACRQYGVESVRLVDVDKNSGHPTVKGMAQISAQVLDAVLSASVI